MTVEEFKRQMGIPLSKELTPYQLQVLLNDNISAMIGGQWGKITGTLSNQLDLVAALALKANLLSPTFTGIPAAPTAAEGTNTTQIATTSFVQTAVLSAGLRVIEKNVDYTAEPGDLIVYDTNGANHTVTPPPAPAVDDKFAVFLKTKTLSYYIAVTGLDTLYTQEDYIQYQYDGSSWNKIDLIQPLIAIVSRTTAQSITLNTDTTVQCGTVVYDPAGITEIASYGIRFPKTAWCSIAALNSIDSLADNGTLFTRPLDDGNVLVNKSLHSAGGGIEKDYVEVLTEVAASSLILLQTRATQTGNTQTATSSPYLIVREQK